MWFQVLKWAQLILTLILESENRWPGGDGAVKKDEVMKSAMAQLRRDGVEPATVGEKGFTLEHEIGALVAILVEILHTTGAFKHTRPNDAREGSGDELETGEGSEEPSSSGRSYAPSPPGGPPPEE